MSITTAKWGNTEIYVKIWSEGMQLQSNSVKWIFGAEDMATCAAGTTQNK